MRLSGLTVNLKLRVITAKYAHRGFFPNPSVSGILGFFGIMEDGKIRPTTGFIPAGELPIVWFPTKQFWEPTVVEADGTIKQFGMTAYWRRTERACPLSQNHFFR